ncbi:hypothetical protein [Pseudomonas savastanoi]|uniref:Uncharacterized protein n=1 Tax=Pseudomonas savastanoi pv. glycinea TaxID=318 RepID=A0A3M3V6D1_PSESG|nr:hypothetical protein [Pseudomonas savastanoi]RMM90678.1 hypothetical protein ALQ70_200056 [Pseudomonas savastanoi pv. glycinea]RMO39802.1 hypothetical protein ALQ42_01449 [Pseudomonas savastanoi pv. glycinea]RMO40922.1 hypothetical protein ALQ43_03671 [Pseudomonas savastanoi pv. glycinea]RMU00409.1 hypothetical protein ALP35_02480 [Pseudomonas savastanoi pv. glycinea]RMU17056.1 hypothetical protein ALP34_02008 [Pseudomonas savastanoi pv. glycinea]
MKKSTETKLAQIMALASLNSPIYKQLYEGIAPAASKLTDLPILSHRRLYELVHHENAISFFAEGVLGGMICQSSATTGSPKATIFGHDEWRQTVQLIALHHWKNGSLCDGDVVANLCVGGDASFMFVHGVIEQFPGTCTELPLGCDHSFEYLYLSCKKFNVNVLAAVNSTIIGLANYILSTSGAEPNIKRILCGGELLYGAQLELIKSAFPMAEIIPFIFATTEAGLIGLSEKGFPHNVFRVCEDACILEILDPETWKPIEQQGVLGVAVVTSLLRTAAPAVRVDIGDRAQWLEPRDCENGRKFSIHGRNYLKKYKLQEGLFLTEADVASVIKLTESKLRFSMLQLQIKDGQLDFKVSLVNQPISNEQALQVLIEALDNTAPAISKSRYVISVELVNLDFFELGIRRKARLIRELRAC